MGNKKINGKNMKTVYKIVKEMDNKYTSILDSPLLKEYSLNNEITADVGYLFCFFNKIDATIYCDNLNVDEFSSLFKFKILKCQTKEIMKLKDLKFEKFPKNRFRIPDIISLSITNTFLKAFWENPKLFNLGFNYFCVPHGTAFCKSIIPIEIIR